MSSLLELSLHKTVDTFLDQPFRLEGNVTSLTPTLAKTLLERLPLPTSSTAIRLAAYIDSNEYWRRTTESKACNSITEHGHSHKRLYFESDLQSLLTKLADEDNEVRLCEQIKPIADLILTLCLSDLQYPLLLDIVCKNLPNLMNIDLKKVSDLKECLPKVLVSSPFLVRLAITESQLNDGDVELIVNSLGASSPSTLLHLDLSHNKITSQGTNVIAEKLLASQDSVLCSVDLSGNKLASEGASIIGQTLEINKSLLSLTLKLNGIDDKGGSDTIESLHKNRSLTNLNLSANKLESSSASSLLKVLEEKKPNDFCALESVVLTSNLFSQEDLVKLKKCKASCFIDVRSMKEPTTKANKAMWLSEMP